MGSLLKFLGMLLALSGVASVIYSWEVFNWDSAYTKIVISFLLIAAGLVTIGMGEILRMLSRIASAAERNVNLTGAGLVQAAVRPTEES